MDSEQTSTGARAAAAVKVYVHGEWPPLLPPNDDEGHGLTTGGDASYTAAIVLSPPRTTTGDDVDGGSGAAARVVRPNVATLGAGATVDDAKAEFLQLYPYNLDGITGEYLSLFDEKNRVLEGSSVIFKLVKDKQDLFVWTASESVVMRLKDTGNAAIEKGSNDLAVKEYTRAISCGKLCKRPPQKLMCLCYSNRSEAYIRLNNFNSAIRDANAAIKCDPTHTKSYFRLGTAHYKLNQYSEAVAAWEKGLPYADPASIKQFQSWISKAKLPQSTTTTKSTSSGTRKYAPALEKLVKEAIENKSWKQAIAMLSAIVEAAPDEHEKLYQLGLIYLQQSKNFTQAAQLFERATKAAPREYQYHLELGRTWCKLKQYPEALLSLRRALENASDKSLAVKDEITVSLADAFMLNGEEDTAMKLYSSILARDQKHCGALRGYARVLFNRAQAAGSSDAKYDDLHQEALQVRLHVLVANQTDEQSREDLCDSVAVPGGIERVFKQLNTLTSEGASAFAWLGSILKDYSVLPQSCELYERSMQLQSNNASFALNWVHVFEARSMYKSALCKAMHFLQINPTLMVGGVSCQSILDIIAPLHPEAWSTERPTSPDVSIAAGEVIPDVSAAEKTAYTPAQLDLVALFFTVTKLLYVLGYLQFVGPLASLLETCREGRDLHLTVVRNEQAYFSCIHENTKLRQLPLTLTPQKIYLIGDSHCLSPAWKNVTHKGSSYTLHPYLVTGIKLWHLRPESRFYPKANFFNVLAQIPHGATVVSILGEIDCREGFLIAIEKGRYKDLDEAVQFSVNIYMELLRNLIKTRNWTIYVHPVSPVLNETRKIVIAFNGILKQRVHEVAATIPSHKLVWLDFFEQMLDPDTEASASASADSTKSAAFRSGFVLKPQFKLDGTHLNPAYVDNLLSPALS
ncbi:E3 ubiquitin-protein ligase [Pelomyxa schiedti]|nr:E3 ubiquitin-protein ligase [Pelomyxa schiedti]